MKTLKKSSALLFQLIILNYNQMKLSDFKKKMQKGIFSFQEAGLIAFDTSPQVLKLELHQWVKRGELIRLKRGVYGFAEFLKDKNEIARALYSPSYISLEYALHFYGLLPDVVFSVTLVTPKITRHFQTPWGEFIYHKIRQDLFWGFDPKTMMGEKEKVLLDYLYLNQHRLVPKADFWETLRFQNLNTINFKKAESLAKKFGSQKVSEFLKSLTEYGKNYGKT